MKQKLLLFTLMFLPIVASAQKVNELQALQIAQQFMEGKTFTTSAKARGTGVTASNDEPYYVFNDQEGEGFVIVSGDERTPAILGYSDSGTFDYDNLPENAKAWIDGYAEQIKSIDKQDGEGRARAANPKLTKEVAPLLGGTVWNQESPFNWLSPKGPTGCTATAMAQIMYYHQWPQNHGSGSISYKWNGTTLSADFSKSNYEWNLMRENYNNTYSEEEGNAVALLMRDCGYSVETNYRDDGSSGYSNLVGPSLVKYFDYKDSYATIKRQYFDTESWEGILRTELDNKRPIFYTGTGHAFVCDGYDKDGLFHFNWGWGGLYNGYFVSCAIEWSDQEITCGIQKSSDSGEILLIPYSTKDFSWSSGNRFSCGLAFSTRAKNIELALALEKTEDGTIQYLPKSSYSNNQYLPTSITLNEAIADGTYKVYPVVRIAGEEWKKFYFNRDKNLQSYVALTVKDGIKSFSNKVESENLLYNGLWYRLNNDSHEAMVIHNLGGGSYSGNITIPSSFTSNGINYRVTGIYESSFKNCSGLTSVSIPNGVVSIGAEAFLGCSSLSSVNIPEGVTIIYDYTFFDCNNLKSITIPSTVTSIKTDAFYGCESLTSVVVPNKVTEIGDEAFGECVGLSSLTLGESVETIGIGAFYYCISLQSVKIPNSVKTIGGIAFNACYELSEVTISKESQLVSIGDQAFNECALNSITLPATLQSIGMGAFWVYSTMEVYSYIQNPFTTEAFGYNQDQNLHVPAGTLSKYMSAKGWSGCFDSIIESDAVTLTAKSYTREYGEANPVFDYDISVASLAGWPKITCNATAYSPVDTYPIVISKGSIRYDKVTYVDGTLTVKKAPLTIKAKSYTIKQGEPLPLYEITYEGFKNNETKNVLKTQPKITCNATTSNKPGTYDIIVSGATADNYEITHVKGTLRIRSLVAAHGDINNDGEIDVTDVVQLIDMVLAGSNDPAGDINGDGDVDVTDVVELIDLVLAG